MLNNTLRTVLITLAACGASHAGAGSLYVGGGFLGVNLGYSQPVSDKLNFRLDYAGGFSRQRSGREEGLDYTGKVKANRASIYADWYTGSSFRLVGGLNFNNTGFTLNGTGSTGTINAKPVNLTGESFNLSVKQPSATPYLGIGLGHRDSADRGWGGYVDAGVSFGRFKVSYDTTIIGKQGITRADTDAEAQKVRDSVNKLRVWPTLMLGLNYRF